MIMRWIIKFFKNFQINKNVYMNKKIFFIIGVSGSGKTTLIQNLKNKFPNNWIYDFDDVGVPTNPTEKWREETTNYWLGKIKENCNSKNLMILAGFFIPSEIEIQSNFDPNINKTWFLLKIKPETIQKRLLKRGWNENQIDYHIKWENNLETEIKKQKEQIIIDCDVNNPQKVFEIFENWITNQEKSESE